MFKRTSMSNLNRGKYFMRLKNKIYESLLRDLLKKKCHFMTDYTLRLLNEQQLKAIDFTNYPLFFILRIT